jgi:LuxR family quorum-sensing system transcriptional regulator CciR
MGMARVGRHGDGGTPHDALSLVEAYMSLVHDVQEFVREANRITEVKELRGLLEGIVPTMGFDYFALVHHVDIFQTNGDVVYLFDFPEAWTDQIARKGYFSDDPVLVACQKSAAPFAWSDVGRIVKLTTRHEEILQSAKTAGLGGGFTVPIHIPGEYTGACSFSTRVGRDFPENSLPAAHYVGCFAFEAARRLVQRRASRKSTHIPLHNKPKLTRRQLDCVVLAGRGKSDRDVGQILGISDQTVHQHMEAAKRKYEVATRMQLVVRALFDSQLAFADLVN